MGVSTRGWVKEGRAYLLQKDIGTRRILSDAMAALSGCGAVLTLVTKAVPINAVTEITSPAIWICLVYRGKAVKKLRIISHPSFPCDPFATAWGDSGRGGRNVRSEHPSAHIHQPRLQRRRERNHTFPLARKHHIEPVDMENPNGEGETPNHTFNSGCGG